MKEEEIKNILKDSKLKATPARIFILQIFSNKCHPLSAENISKKLKKKDIDLVTIYRTLASFEEAGILRKVDLHKESQYYELGEHHHHHIICSKCGFVEELEGCDIEKLASKLVSRSSNFKTIKDHSLEFFGVCKRCL
ncbi:MAG: Fur family transcriptional regulator [Candidatus Paceibacterota bacterium]